MVKGKYRVYWLSIFLVLLVFVSVISIDIYKALGTIITLDDLDASSGDYSVTEYSGYSVIQITEGGEYTLTQNNINTAVSVNIIVESDEEVTLLLDGINIKAGDYEQASLLDTKTVGTAAIAIQGNTNCKIILADGSENTIVGRTKMGSGWFGSSSATSNSPLHTAGISVENTIVSGEIRLASLLIEGENGLASTGVLTVTGGHQAAAIGGNIDRLSGNITINSGIINATSGDFGAAIGDGDTVEPKNNGIIWTVGETNSIAKIIINGGEVWTTATADTPGIGSADELVTGYNATVDEWTGMEIEINGGSIVAIGGSQKWSPSAAIGAGADTNLSSSNIVINVGTEENPTQIIAVTRTKNGSFAVSNTGGSSIPALSADSSASVLNIKFDSSKVASDIDFWYLVDPTYSTGPTEDFPNEILERMGNISILGMAVVLPEGTYRVSEDTDNDGADVDDPILADDLVVGGNGAITCEEQSNSSLVCRFPLEIMSPEDVEVPVHSNATFDVEILSKSDGSAISYQWYISTDNGSSWEEITGATSDSYVVEDVLLSYSGYLYRCDVTENYSGDIVVLSSIAAKLTVLRELEYEFFVNTLLDNETYSVNDRRIDLYDLNGNLVKNFTNNSGIYKVVVPTGTYRVYIDGIDYGTDVVINSTGSSISINYYSVSLDLVSDNTNDVVNINSTDYSSSFDKKLIYLEGSSVSVLGKPNGESEIVSAKINEQSIINDVLNGYSFDIQEKANVAVEFDYKKYDVNVSVYLNDSLYSDVDGEFKLVSDKFGEFKLINSDGVLSGSVPADTYKLYRDSEVIKDSISFGSTSNEARVDYYSVDLDVDSENESDSVTIGDSCFYTDIDNAVILLSGESVNVKADAANEMKVTSYLVNNISNDVSDITNGVTLVVDKNIKLYVKFEKIKYDINVNALLDGTSYSEINSKYELYDSAGISYQLINNNGVYSASLAAGDYDLYIDEVDSNVNFTVSKDSKEFNVNYYSVNLELVSPNTLDSVLINNNNLNSLIVLSGNKINIKGIPADEMEIIKYTINTSNSKIDDLLNGTDIVVNDTTNIYVEFDYIKYEFDITANLDDIKYDGITDTYELYVNGVKKYSLRNDSGVYKGTSVAGDYDLFINGLDSGIDLSISADSKEFIVDYYSLDLEIISSVSDDGILVNGIKYVDDTDDALIVLNGTTINLKSSADEERKVIQYTLNDEITDVSEINNGIDLVMDSTKKVYLKFDYITYDVNVSINLDDKIYSSLVADVYVLDSSNKKISSVTLSEGVVNFNCKADTYKLYVDDEMVKEFTVANDVLTFEVDYYSVNLEINKAHDDDTIKIDDVSYIRNTVENEIVILKDNEVSLKAIVSDESYLAGFTINNVNGNVDDLINGYNLTIVKKTDIVVSMSVVGYDITIDTKIDDTIYETNNRIYSLYDDNNKLVSTLSLNKGVLTGNVVAGKYYLYENGTNLNYEIVVSSTNTKFEINYYTVSLEIINSLNNNVVIDGNAYGSSFDKGLVYYEGTTINVSANTDSETEVVRYTVNDVDSTFDKKITLDTPIKLYVEFDYIKFNITIDVNLDNEIYANVEHEYSLYKDGTKVIDLTNNNGVLSGKVINGRYYIYENGINTNKYIDVNSSSKKFEINYYSVNVDIKKVVSSDEYMLNNQSYNIDDTLIVLEGETVNVKAVPGEESRLVLYKVNDGNDDIDKVLKGTDIVVSETVNIYLEYGYVTYDVILNVYLDDDIYTSLVGDVYVKDSSNKKIDSAIYNSGTLQFFGRADTYKLYVDDKIIKEFTVTSSDTNFIVNYYSVNLEFDPVFDADTVELNGACFKADTLENEIVLLAGEEVTLKVVSDTESEVELFKVNSIDGDISKLLDGMSITVDEKTNIVIAMKVITYNFSLQTNLDDETYLSNSREYSLYKDGVKVVDLTNNSGVYTSNLASGEYSIYIDGKDSGKKVEVTSTNKEFILDYYTVSLEMVNSLGNSVVVDGNTYNSDFTKELVYIADTKIDVNANTDSETEVVKYTVNEVDSSFDDKVTINKPIKLYVEFDYIDFDITIDVKLDNEIYTNVEHEYSLYKDGNKALDLTKKNGILSGKVINGKYEIYEDGVATNKFIEVSSTSKKFEINYYSLNIKLDNLSGEDKVIINNKEYNSKENRIIFLEGSSASLKAIPELYREVRVFTINESDSDISELLTGMNYTINEKTDVYVKFYIIEYAVKINILLDDVLDTDANGIYRLYDTNGVKVSNLTRSDGVLSASVGYGDYYIYNEDVNTNVKISVDENTNEFNLLYYSVNLDIETINVLDSVTINDVVYKEDTKDRDIIVLKDSVIEFDALASDDTEVYEFKINSVDSDVNSTKIIQINKETDLYVKFGNKRYDQLMNIYIDDTLIDDYTLVPSVTLKNGDTVYTSESKIVNGNYEVLLDNNSTNIYINVNKGVVDVYFYNVNLTGDKGVATLTGNGLYLKGLDVNLSATLNPGYNYDGWYNGDDLYDTGLSIVINDISSKYDLVSKTIALKPYEPVISPHNGYYDYGFNEDKHIDLDVEPYEGTTITQYQWYKCNDDECSSKELIEGAIESDYIPKDKNVGKYNYYCEVVIKRDDNGETINTGGIVRVDINPIKPIVALEDKVEYYTGSEINSNKVSLDNVIENDEFDITYLYYLDEEYTIPTNNLNSGALVEGGVPVNVGVYYVKAVVDGNSNYDAAVAGAKLTILEVIVPEVPEKIEDVKNPVTLDKILIIVVGLFIGVIVLFKGIPYLLKTRY